MTPGGCGTSFLTDTFHVTINARDSVHIHTDTALCARDGMTFSAPSGYLFYQWSNGAVGQSIGLSSTVGTDELWVSCVDSCYLPDLIDTFSIQVDSFDLSFSLGNDTFACNSIQLQIADTDVKYLWQDGSTNKDYTTTQSGIYYATVSKGACNYSDTIGLSIISLVPYNFDTIVCLDYKFSVMLNANVPNGADVAWNNSLHQTSLVVTDTGNFVAVITDSVCNAVDTFHVIGRDCTCWPFIPGAFVPEGSVTKNKGFIPIIDPHCNVSQYTFSIFDRWGKLVFTTNDPSVAWDGTYDGVPAPLDVYMYECTFWGGLLNKKFYFKGDVTLVR